MAKSQTQLKGFHKQLYANKMDSLEEMDKPLGRNNIPRLNKEEIFFFYVNRSITNSGIEIVI